MLRETQEVKIEVIGVDVNTRHLVINGEYILPIYGDAIETQDAIKVWRESIADYPELLDWLDVPFNQLPDSYFKNGHIQPLTLDEPIPFEGEPWPPSNDEFEPEGEELPV